MNLGMYNFDGKWYSVSRIVELSKKIKPKQVIVDDYVHLLSQPVWAPVRPIDVLMFPKEYPEHDNRIKKANMKFPILVNNGNIIDGIHRLCKAYRKKQKKISARIIDNNTLKKAQFHLLTDNEKNRRANIVGLWQLKGDNTLYNIS